MAKFDSNIDFFELLGLDAGAVSAYGVEGLRGIIKDKKKEWTAQAVNPLYQQQARSNLERVREFERLLGEPEALEAYVKHMQWTQAEKRQRQEQEVGWLVRIAIADRNSLTARQRELLLKHAAAENIPANLVDTVIEKLKVTVEPGESAPPGLPQLPHKSPAMDRTVLSQINGWLKVLDKGSCYELLDLPARTTPARIVATAEVLYERWSRILPKTSECVAWEKSLQACLTYLKNQEEKAKYDRALFNQRIDRFVQRVDLALAGSKFTREQHVTLARVGVREFGLSTAAVNKCILARAVANGIYLNKPVSVSLQLQGQVQCTRCYSWNPLGNGRCWKCGASLGRRCENPKCRKPMPANAKVCEHCQLPLAKGKRYVELLHLADVSLDRGDFETARESCRLAGQILPSEDIDARLNRAGKIRALSGSVERNLSGRAFSAAHADLTQLVQFAPNFSREGIPKLEELTKQIEERQKKLDSVPDGASLADRAQHLLDMMADWTDCRDAYVRLRRVCEEYLSQRKYRDALVLARKLLPYRPKDEQFQQSVNRLEQLVNQAEELQQRRDDALREWKRAVGENRLYAAEKALKTFAELGGGGPEPADVQAVEQQLTLLRKEAEEIRAFADTSESHDPVIERYLALLEQCPDCREALSALQNTPPDPPQRPRGLSLTVEGNYRRLTWEPPETGKQPTGYLVSRSLTRAGSDQGEGAYKTICEGSDRHFVDTEIVHNGSVLRYFVQAVYSRRLEVGGNLLRAFTVKSGPTDPQAVLIWQEVIGLRTVRRDGRLELRWHQPAGVRQVRVERWDGRPDDDAPRQTLAPTNNGLLVDSAVQPDQLYTYRVFCVYDGPDGEFTTHGVQVVASLTESASPSDQLQDVKNLQATVEGRSVRLTWQWPEGCRRVYLYRRQGTRPAQAMGGFDRRWKVSREEYNDRGVVEQLTAHHSGEVYYRAFAEYSEAENTRLAAGEDEGAEAHVSLPTVEEQSTQQSAVSRQPLKADR